MVKAGKKEKVLFRLSSSCKLVMTRKCRNRKFWFESPYLSRSSGSTPTVGSSVRIWDIKISDWWLQARNRKWKLLKSILIENDQSIPIEKLQPVRPNIAWKAYRKRSKRFISSRYNLENSNRFRRIRIRTRSIWKQETLSSFPLVPDCTRRGNRCDRSKEATYLISGVVACAPRWLQMINLCEYSFFKRERDFKFRMC